MAAHPLTSSGLRQSHHRFRLAGIARLGAQQVPPTDRNQDALHLECASDDLAGRWLEKDLLRSAAAPDIRHPSLPIRASSGRLSSATKRAFDVITAIMMLIVLSPLFLVIALVIKWKMSGDVIFAQRRCGRHGKPFVCYKFRTMVPDAHRFVECDGQLRGQYLHAWKLANDPRVTPLGRVLRRTSLDELPQLWNVLKGDMSIVGPRPVQEQELQDCYGDHAHIVTTVRPGLTGLWQVSGRSSLPYEQRVQLDVLYVQRARFWFDLIIILRTIPVLFGSKDAC